MRSARLRRRARMPFIAYSDQPDLRCRNASRCPANRRRHPIAAVSSGAGRVAHAPPAHRSAPGQDRAEHISSTRCPAATGGDRPSGGSASARKGPGFAASIRRGSPHCHRALRSPYVPHGRTRHPPRAGGTRHLRHLHPAQAAAARKGARRAPVRARLRLPAGGRPADRDRRAGRGRARGREDPGAARRHRQRQDLHHGQGDRGAAAPGAGARAQQDPRRAALRRVQELLPRQRGRVFRLLLRLLPARGLRAALGHLHREGKLGERGDRPDAPFGHPLAARARRRDHRRFGLVHLRHRLGSRPIRR